MPHYTNYGGTTQLSVQPEKEGFGSFEPREAKFQEASTNDELTGLKGLNWGEICDVGASLRQSDDFIKLGDIKGDRLFTTGGGGDFITVEGRPRNIWTNGGASTFEDRDRGATVYVDEDVDGFLKLGDIKGELQTTDLRSENRFVIERFASGSAVESFEPLAGMNSFQFNQSARNTADGFRTAGGGKSIVHPEFRLGGNSAPAGTTFITETFEPAVGMNSFGESLNHVLEISGNAGPGGTSFMTGKFDMPTENIGGSADPGGTSF